MSGLSHEAQNLVNHVTSAIGALRSGGTYRAGEQRWAVATERNAGIITGKIVAACTNHETLVEAEAELRQRGHEVHRDDARGRLTVTPAAT